MQTSLERIANKAKREKNYRFRNLYGMLNNEFIYESWKKLNKKAATGVDKISYNEYNKNIGNNIESLVGRLKGKKYKAKLIRRKLIPKGKDKMRPLGIPAIEDKLLQHAVARILESIFEQDFFTSSYGYRPNISVHNAVKDIRDTLGTKRYKYVVEADIKGYFDSINHEWLVKMLELRINDKALIRLIKKWLKAGVLESDGKVTHPVTGSPQGGVILTILANIYMHYVVVLWFEKVVKKYSKGEAKIFVYADDFICLFENEYDAKRFYNVLKKRLGKFGLTVSEEKTNIINFRQGTKGVIEFLGFEFLWSRNRNKKIRIRTSKKKLNKSIKNFKEWCKRNRNKRLDELFKRMNMKLRGYYNYYGIKGNSVSLAKFYYHIETALFKWLNQRSQRKSYKWENFKAMIKHFKILKPKLVWNW